MIWRIILVAIGVIALGAGLLFYYLNPDRLVVHDYSGFEHYRFNQQGGLGFCADPTMVFAASIERQGGKELSLTHSRLRVDPGSAGPCASELETAEGCLVVEEQPARVLSDAEAARVGVVFSAVRINPNPLWQCRTMGIDPCLIMRHQWDDTDHDSYVCSTDRMSTKKSIIRPSQIAPAMAAPASPSHISPEFTWGWVTSWFVAAG